MPDQKHDDDLVIPDRIRDLLLERKHTIAVAESVTAGYLQVAFSLGEDARKFFQGGITVYNLGQKARHLQVDPILATACNSVSEEVAAQMARHVTGLFTSDWGIGITGYAALVPEKGINELFACYAFYFRNKEMARKTVSVEKNCPAAVMKCYTQHVLDHFLRILAK